MDKITEIIQKVFKHGVKAEKLDLVSEENSHLGHTLGIEEAQQAIIDLLPSDEEIRQIIGVRINIDYKNSLSVAQAIRKQLLENMGVEG